MNNGPNFKKILIAPLDWGLGHATRCIPLIKYLQTLNCEITVAGSASSIVLLKTEFPNINFFELNSYNINYTRNKRLMIFKVAIQIPKILKAIKKENQWLENFLQNHHFDVVISDNRYGFYSRKIYSVFITHQLQINTGFKAGDTFFRKFIYSHINHFNECWVPDFKGTENIAGKLSHPSRLPKIPVNYIGIISRFIEASHQQYQYDYFVIISGPEPQRTIFQKKIIAFAIANKQKFLFVLGKPAKEKLETENSNCKIYNHLSTDEMQQAFSDCEFVVSRTGYTTVMDTIILKKKSIMIPTPGQTEQEYLGEHLMQQKWSYVFLQNDDFSTHFKKAKGFFYEFPSVQPMLYKTFLDDFISKIK